MTGEAQTATGSPETGDGTPPDAAGEGLTPQADARDGPTQVEGVGKRCGSVAFEPRTDHGAFEIRAWDVGCDRARRVAGAADGQIADTYQVAGFTCRTSGPDEGGPRRSFDYTCEDDGARVTFTAS